MSAYNHYHIPVPAVYDINVTCVKAQMASGFKIAFLYLEVKAGWLGLHFIRIKMCSPPKNKESHPPYTNNHD